jgi:hypothetical protein
MRILNSTIVGGVLALAALALPAMAMSADWEKVRQQGLMQLVFVSKARGRDRSVYQDAIASLCRPGQRCYLLFWSDRSKVPVRLPMSDRELNAQVGSYTRNPSSGYDKLILSCRFGRASGDCLP